MSEPINRVIRFLGPLEAGTTIEAAGDHLEVTIRTEHFTLRTAIDIETARKMRDALGKAIGELTDEEEN